MRISAFRYVVESRGRPGSSDFLIKHFGLEGCIYLAGGS